MRTARSASSTPPEPALRTAGTGRIGADSAAQCRVTSTAAELATHLRIRQVVFVDEQHVFAGDDLDEHDVDPATLHVVGFHEGVPAGAVRLYPTAEQRCWVGDRLAVLSAFRRSGLGGPLVTFAVEMAGRLGGSRMDAHIQLSNVAFFERLGWRRVGGPADYLGIPHQAMAIGLGDRNGDR